MMRTMQRRAFLRRRRQQAKRQRRLQIEQMERRRLLAVYNVINTNDTGAGSLRQAIIDSNFNAGADQIQFAIPGPGPHSIAPATAFPTITDPLTIDATTQPGYAGTPVVELNGATVPAVGLTLLSGSNGSAIRGLAINRFGGAGIEIQSDSNAIEGNYIGTSLGGDLAQGNGTWGIIIIGGASNMVGGTTPAPAI